MNIEYRLHNMAARAYHYLNVIAFPKWCDEGVFNNDNGFVESFRLDDGKANYMYHRRLRVQGRQIWTFSMAAALGIYEEKKLVLCAKKGWNAVMSQYAYKDGGFVHSVHGKDGCFLNDERYLYEQAFVLLGASGMYVATKDIKYLQKAKELYLWISTKMKADEGFFTSVGAPEEPRQQNPHMHLFEALMSLFEASDDVYWFLEAQKIYNLYQKYFYDQECGLLREFFNADWKSYDVEKGDNIEPGHNYEWTWLLRHYAKVGGASTETVDRLYQFALQGTNSDGIGYDECFPDGKIKRETSRLWVQTEALKAHLAQYEFYGDVAYIKKAEQCLDNIFHFYLRKDGLWGDQIDKEYKELSDICPASTFYHLFLAFSEVIRIAEL